MSLTPFAIDVATLIVALLLACLGFLWRWYKTHQVPEAYYFLTCVFNGAVVVPLLLLCLGLFYPEATKAVSQSNRVLVFLAYGFTTFWALRSIFTIK